MAKAARNLAFGAAALTLTGCATALPEDTLKISDITYNLADYHRQTVTVVGYWAVRTDHIMLDSGEVGQEPCLYVYPESRKLFRGKRNLWVTVTGVIDAKWADPPEPGWERYQQLCYDGAIDIKKVWLRVN